MKTMNTVFLTLLASCVLLAAPLFAHSVPLIESQPTPAADMPYTDQYGEAHTVADQLGKLTAVHFWATWCAPCVDELPEVDAAAKAYGKHGFKVIAISLDGDNALKRVKEFLASHGITHLEPALDMGMRSFKAADTLGLPTTIMIDANGNEVARATGPMRWGDPNVHKFITSHLK